MERVELKYTHMKYPYVKWTASENMLQSPGTLLRALGDRGERSPKGRDGCARAAGSLCGRDQRNSAEQLCANED